MIVISRKDGRSKWIITRCKVCKGSGRYKIQEQEKEEFNYDSFSCPECEGRGYMKEVTYLSEKQLRDYRNENI